MIPSEYNLPDAYRGDTYDPIIFVFTDQNGSGISFDNSIAVAQVRNSRNGLLLQWSSEDGTINISGNTLTFASVDCNRMKIPAGTHNFDLQVNTSGICDTFINGTWNIIQDVTDI